MKQMFLQVFIIYLNPMHNEKYLKIYKGTQISQQDLVKIHNKDMFMLCY